MKIKKFNESVNNWTADKLKNIIKDHDYLTKILGKYLKLKISSDSDIVFFYFDVRERFMIEYNDNEGENYSSEVDYDIIINFINSKNKTSAKKKWTINELFDHCEKYKKLTEIIALYLRWKIGDYEDENENSYHDIIFFFEGNTIQYSDDDMDGNDYVVEDYDEMINFINNSEIFLNAKKYNL